VEVTNLEVALRGYGAWNRGDLEGFLEGLHPEIVLTTSGYFADQAVTWRGHDGMRELWEALRSPWEDFHMEPREIWEDASGRHVAVLLTVSGRGRDGIEASASFSHVFEMESGMATTLDAFPSWEQGLALARERGGELTGTPLTVT
jgi:ketosteroid isomerase-like protein